MLGMRHCTNSKAGDIVDLGSDHRTVWASFATHGKGRKKVSKGKTTRKQTEWPPHDTSLYCAKLEQLSNDVQLTLELENKCDGIETAIMKAMRSSERLHPPIDGASTDHDAVIADLISHRKALPHSSASTRARISKEIMKRIKWKRREQAEAKIQAVLDKFTGLHAISGIKSRRRKLLNAEMSDGAGNKVNTRKGIADIFADFYEELYKTKQEPDSCA